MCNPYQPINKRGTVVFKPEKTFLLFYQLLIIVVVSVLIYLYTLGNDFACDDKFTITNNYLIRSWHKLPTIFTNDYFTSSGELSYRPVVTLSYFIDYFFWHLKPLGYHLTNLLLHSLNSVFLFFPVRLKADYVVPNANSPLELSFVLSFPSHHFCNCNYLQAVFLFKGLVFRYSMVLCCLDSCLKYYSYRKYNG